MTINETLDRVILDSSERVFYLAKRRLRHRWYTIWLVIVAASVGFALYSLFVRANIFNYYPSSCLGTWDNPQNAQDEPSLGPNAKPEEFNKDNSTFYGGGAKQVFCGGFRSNGDETEKIFKKAVLRFSWAIASPTPTPMVEQSDFENNILDLAPDEEIIVVPDGSLPDPASVSGEIVIPDLSPLASPANPLEITSPTALPSPTPEATPEPLPSPSPTPLPAEEPTPAPTPEPTPESTVEPTMELVPEPTTEPALPILSPTSSEKQNRGSSIFQPDSSNLGKIGTEPPVSLLKRFTLASIFSDIASDSVLPSVEPSPLPEISVSPSPSFTPAPTSSPSFTPPASSSLLITPLSPSPSVFGSSTSKQYELTTEPVVTETPASASLAEDDESGSASASYSLDDFLEVFYTTDGQNWQSLGRVNKGNFENFELEIPIISWEELGKLQINVAGTFTTDASQKVFLDGMRIEAEFEKMAEKKKKDVSSDKLIFQLEKNLAKWNISKSASTSAQALEFVSRITENEDRFYKISDIDGDLVPDFAINIKNVHNGETGYDFKKFEIYSGKEGALIGQFEEAESEGHYYLIFSELPDINSDGINDYAVLDPGFSTGEGGAIANERGRISARSGKDNSTLWVYAGTTDYQFYGDNSVMKLGADYDSDGLEDLLVSAPLYEKEGKRGAVLIVSSSRGELIDLYQGKWATGDDLSVIYRFDIGPDLNSDGWPEIILGEIHNRPDGQDSKVSLLSGKDLSVIENIANPDSDEFSYFGVGVAFIGDENGDGIDDILVEAIRKQFSPNDFLEKFLIFSSVDRSFITYYYEE